jgi:hypothetical protein
MLFKVSESQRKIKECGYRIHMILVSLCVIFLENLPAVININSKAYVSII